jgi:hypothetical protein
MEFNEGDRATMHALLEAWRYSESIATQGVIQVINPGVGL